jgi:hypothetical protein
MMHRVANRFSVGCLLALSALTVQAQGAATLAFSGGAYVLTIPYLEYGSGAAKLAYRATLNSASLSEFTLAAGSVAGTSLIAGATNPATVSASSGSFRLILPRVEVNGKTYTAALTTSDLARFVVDANSVAEVPATGPLPTGVTVGESGTQPVGSTAFGSSSRLAVRWTAPVAPVVDHYEITATESLMNTQVSVQAAGTATGATLTLLKAAVTVKACADSACIVAGSAASVSATTPAEYWQLQGSGHAVTTLTSPVSDGNARLSATRFGAEAGANANTVQFYYGPRGVSGQSVASSGVVSASDPASYLSGFTSYASTSGVRSPTDMTAATTSGIRDIMTGQGVPLGTALGGPAVRLFFESNDADGKTRIYSVDSTDGYVGRDFNRGAATTCSLRADYLSDGNCPATVEIGVEGDATRPTNKISAARQNKIGWPTLDDWRWNGEVGTFMVYTIDQISGCTTASHNHGYAVWDGSRFVPQYETNGCPKAFKSAQAAVPMHIGDVRYKLYFGDPAVTTGKPAGTTLPFTGPKKLLYADGTSSGDAGIVDFEDWESVANARGLNFLWPDGTVLDDAAEGFIDDFHFLTPTGSLDVQVLYLSITDGSIAPISATAVLLNP